MEQELFIRVAVEDDKLPRGTSPERVALLGIKAIRGAYGNMDGFIKADLLVHEGNLPIGKELNDNLAEIPVTDFEFDTRACNIFRREGIVTIGQLCLMSPDQLHQIRGLGEKTFDRISEVLETFGIARFSKYPGNQNVRWE